MAVRERIQAAQQANAPMLIGEGRCAICRQMTTVVAYVPGDLVRAADRLSAARGSEGAIPMAPGAPSVLMIVARGETSLYQYVFQRFRWGPEVEVLFDRRQGERRRLEETPAIERRHTQRRRSGRDDLLKTQGWLVVQRGSGGTRAS